LYSESGIEAVNTTAPPLDTELASALKVIAGPVALLAGVITVVIKRKRNSIPTKDIARFRGRAPALVRRVFVVIFKSILFSIVTSKATF
jgi:hypothetical protein